MKEESFPALYRDADRVAKRSQSQHFALLFLQSMALLGGAVLSALSGASQHMAVVSACVFFAGIALSLLAAFLRLEDEWYRARALAESVKTIAWRYMCRAAPYVETPDPASADHLLGDAIRDLIRENSVLGAKMGGGAAAAAQVTIDMRNARAKDLAGRKAFYETERIEDQQKWYTKKAARCTIVYRRWFTLFLAIQAAAAITCLIRIENPNIETWWVDLLSIVAGAVLTWMQAHRYRELASAYSLTSHEIGALRLKLPPINNEASFSDFIGDSENAFSREHTQWIARKDVA